MIDQIEDHSYLLSTLNYLAASAQDNLISDPLKYKQLQDRRLQRIIALCEDAEYVQFKHGKMYFADEDARFFMNGGWLEQYTHQLLVQLKTKRSAIQDIGRSVEIIWHREGQRIKNEIDLVVLVNNQLHIIECKTKKYSKESAATKVVYKVDTLQELLGGEKCKSLFLSYHPIERKDLNRALSLNIDVCAGQRLTHLAEFLLQWIDESIRPS